MPLYKDFVKKELESDISQEGAKIQFAQVFPSFMEHALKSKSGEEESKSNSLTVASLQVD